MGTPFLGEIRLLSFNFAPKGWALCNGQFFPINQNQALFSLLGTSYGGNGQTTFALPDLRGRMPVHFGDGYDLGQAAGEEFTTLKISELPAHSHAVTAGKSANSTDPTGGFLAASTKPAFSAASPSTAMEPTGLGSTGGSQPHPNLPPYLPLNFAIALQGIFPSRN